MVFYFEKLSPELVDPFLEMVSLNKWSQVVSFCDRHGLCSEKIGCCGSVDPLKRAISEYFPETETQKEKVANKQSSIVDE